jgi:hypothetical protein
MSLMAEHQLFNIKKMKKKKEKKKKKKERNVKEVVRDTAFNTGQEKQLLFWF